MRSTSFLSNTSSILHVENGILKICATLSASSVVFPHIASIENPCFDKLVNYDLSSGSSKIFMIHIC